MTRMHTWQLRAGLARRLSDRYAAEVPAYSELLLVSSEVNADVVCRRGSDAERLGGISRVTTERHGAIRVGTPTELAQLASILAAFGMYPVGFYDLRGAAPAPVPVVSTAFRPIAADELALNPFRIFVSLLVPEDRRFFPVDLAARLTAFLDSRRLFSPELLELAVHAERDGGLPAKHAERLLALAVAAFTLTRQPVDRAWYTTLERISSVAADIGGTSTTHINHLTPRVLDIDELYRRMAARGIEMIDHIQGPPRWDGPDILLRQTSFRALAESRYFREADGTVTDTALRVRFGEVEQRGVAPTPAGLSCYNRMMSVVDAQLADKPGSDRQHVLQEVWRKHLAATERGLIEEDLAYFTFRTSENRPHGIQPPSTVLGLLDDGWIVAEPIVYEDFLPRSAAGIFASNLSRQGSTVPEGSGAPRDRAWMEQIIGRPISDPAALYAAQRTASLTRVVHDLGLPKVDLPLMHPGRSGGRDRCPGG